jgi:hypothetical protein
VSFGFAALPSQTNDPRLTPRLQVLVPILPNKGDEPLPNELLLGQRVTRVNLFGPAAADERDENGDDKQNRHCNLGQEQTDEVKQREADHQYRHQGDRKAFDWVHEHNVPQAELNCNGVNAPLFCSLHACPVAEA